MEMQLSPSKNALVITINVLEKEMEKEPISAARVVALSTAITALSSIIQVGL